MDYKSHQKFITEAGKYIGTEVTLLKELPNKQKERKKFKLIGVYEEGRGEITDPIFTTSDNPNNYPSWGAWGILKAGDGQEITRIALRVILDTILLGKELEYDY
jgi:hypothetical protein